MLFQSSNASNLKLHEIISEIKKFLDLDKNSQYKLTIGTDSEVKRDKESGVYLELITAIVIYRKGFGGKYFWARQKQTKNKTLRDKIYQEVLLSLNMAQILVPELKIQLSEYTENYDLEIHIDAGEYGKTRDMIREVVGIVTGSGFVAKTKPYSYAASNIADKFN